MVQTGWLPDELPASRQAREVADVLSYGETLEERHARRQAAAAAKTRRERVRDSEDHAASQNWLDRMLGRPAASSVQEVFARASEAGDADDAAAERAEARRLRRLSGEQTGVLFDPNVGVVESAPVQRAQAQRADDVRQLQRAYEVDAWMAGYRRRHPEYAVRSAAPSAVAANGHGRFPPGCNCPYRGEGTAHTHCFPNHPQGATNLGETQRGACRHGFVPTSCAECRASRSTSRGRAEISR